MNMAASPASHSQKSFSCNSLLSTTQSTRQSQGQFCRVGYSIDNRIAFQSMYVLKIKCIRGLL